MGQSTSADKAKRRDGDGRGAGSTASRWQRVPTAAVASEERGCTTDGGGNGPDPRRGKLPQVLPNQSSTSHMTDDALFRSAPAAYAAPAPSSSPPLPHLRHSSQSLQSSPAREHSSPPRRPPQPLAVATPPLRPTAASGQRPSLQSPFIPADQTAYSGNYQPQAHAHAPPQYQTPPQPMHYGGTACDGKNPSAAVTAAPTRSSDKRHHSSTSPASPHLLTASNAFLPCASNNSFGANNSNTNSFDAPPRRGPAYMGEMGVMRQIPPPSHSPPPPQQARPHVAVPHRPSQDISLDAEKILMYGRMAASPSLNTSQTSYGAVTQQRQSPAIDRRAASPGVGGERKSDARRELPAEQRCVPNRIARCDTIWCNPSWLTSTEYMIVDRWQQQLFGANAGSRSPPLSFRQGEHVPAGRAAVECIEHGMDFAQPNRSTGVRYPCSSQPTMDVIPTGPGYFKMLQAAWKNEAGCGRAITTRQRKFDEEDYDILDFMEELTGPVLNPPILLSDALKMMVPVWEEEGMYEIVGEKAPSRRAQRQ